jgi:hypothetical protein
LLINKFARPRNVFFQADDPAGAIVGGATAVETKAVDTDKTPLTVTTTSTQAANPSDAETQLQRLAELESMRKKVAELEAASAKMTSDANNRAEQAQTEAQKYKTMAAEALKKASLQSYGLDAGLISRITGETADEIEQSVKDLSNYIKPANSVSGIPTIASPAAVEHSLAKSALDVVSNGALGSVTKNSSREKIAKLSTGLYALQLTAPNNQPRR